MSGRISPAAIRLASVLAGLVAWEIYGRAIHTVIFAYPSTIGRALIELTRTGELPFYLRGSLVVLALGLGLAIVIGIPVGILMARRATVEYALEPYINALYSTPTVALIPLIVLWAGFQVKAKVILVFLFCVFPILINTYQGVKNTDARLLEVARSFCAGEWSMWRDLMVPSAAPYILAGIRLGIGRGLVGMVVAEFYTAITGLGYMIVQYANNFRTDRLFVPIVVLMILGVGLTSLLRRIERSVAPWLHVAQHE
ncbi:MAG: ABC transporter permease [Bacillati bacterium ANGP1]|uniref:ABC transporter permease n=1 Tax=Candidatus Segetimicrobium genomatis TaxID=2569760 RepID=A0A537JM56_9BACT|nr:MAG: ABC transporter permease [Terrabacteria group bacterium ANGP1]